jgi:HlyD family secretion protein
MCQPSHSRAVCLAIVMIFVTATGGCEHSPEPDGTKGRPALARVEIVHPERHTVRRSVGEPGELQAFETTPIHAKIAGYVKKWTVNIGAEVKKGQALAELFVPELDAEVRLKEASVRQAVAQQEQANAAIKMAEANVRGAEAKLVEVRAGVTRAQADLTLWQAQTERVQALVTGRASTEQLLDETKSKLRSAEAACAEIDAKVKTALVAVLQCHAARDQARTDLAAAAASVEVAKEDARRSEALLGYCKIEAPFDGIVTHRNVDTGDLTRAGADAEPLFVIARFDIVTIRVNVPEGFASEVHPGDRASVKLQEMKGQIVEGKVSRVSWALDPKTRTMRAEIDIPNPGAKLLPGLYAYATVIVAEHLDALTVPTTAVITDKEKTLCVVVAGGRAERRPIAVGIMDGTLAEVVSGLDGSEAVVKASAASLIDGQQVSVAVPPNSAPSGAKSSRLY